jgi:hypothetical protein
MLNFNSNNKSWKMYTNTITSISGDDLLIKPNNTNDLILEVSANNHIIISKNGDISYSINTKIASIDTSFSNVYTRFNAITTSFGDVNTKFLLIDASFNNKLASISGDLIPLNDICYNLGSETKRWTNAYIRDISVSNISASGNIVPFFNLSGSLGVSSRIWANAFIKDISGLVTINGLPYVNDLTNVTTNINPSINNSGSLGINTRIWGNAFIRDLSVSSIDVSVNIAPLNNNSGSLGVSNRIWRNAFIQKLSAGSIDVSVNCNPLRDNSGSLGSILQPWGNAYIRDLSVINIIDASNLRIGNFFSTNFPTTNPALPIRVNISNTSTYSTVDNFGLQVINTTTGTSNWSAINVEAKSISSLNKAGIQFSIKSSNGTPYNVWNIHCRDGDTSLIFTKINNFHTMTDGNATAYIREITGAFVTQSDDRLKHNEIIINNGLTIIDQLVPKFYQKTQVMLDAHYYGDLSGYTWSYEAGLIAQEVLQINDISFAVGRGDHYDISNNLIPSTYSLGYNHIFIYGLAAIKELHKKVKTQELSILNLETNISSQETTLFNQQSIINSLIARIEALENKV